MAVQRSGAGIPHDSTQFFSSHMKLFSRQRGFIPRPTHDRLAALRQASRHFPETGKPREAGTPGPPPLFFSAISVYPEPACRRRASKGALLSVRSALNLFSFIAPPCSKTDSD